jgi:hypothetical protein
MAYIDTFNTATGDTTTLSRCTVAVAKYARYLLGLSPAPSATRLAWAKEAVHDAPREAKAIMWGVVGDPAYVQDGPNISDAALQGAVETAVNAITP